MKTKKINNTLLLNKNTISNLDVEEMGIAKGAIKKDKTKGQYCFSVGTICISFEYPCLTVV